MGSLDSRISDHMERAVQELARRRDASFTKQQEKERRFQRKRRRDALAAAAHANTKAADRTVRMQVR